MDIFKTLNEQEVKEFKSYARTHPEGLDEFQSKREVWHPVIIQEYTIMERELKDE